MVDPHLQERFSRHCTDAAFGYTAATAAAYAAVADQVLNFWASVFEPPRRSAAAPEPVWSWLPAPVRQEPPPTPFAPFFWAAAPQRRESSVGFLGAGFPFCSTGQAPFPTWFGMFPFAAPPTVWPMAAMLIASGMPHSVAWPTAEANAAVMDAADVAAVSVQRAFAGHRTEGGHSARQFWPPAQLMMLAALMPFNIGAMLAAVRMA